MDMRNMKIATLHSVDKPMTQEPVEERQDLLDDFLQKEGIIPEHRNLVSDSSAPVYEALLRDASLGRFDLLLVKSFEQIAPCDERNLPRLRIYSLEDQEMREIGTLDQPLTETENDTPDIKRAVIYYGREQSAETFEVPAIEEQCM